MVAISLFISSMAAVEFDCVWRKRDPCDPNSAVASKIHGKNDMVFSALKTVCVNGAVGAITYGVGVVYKRLEAQGGDEILDECGGFRVMEIAKIRHVDSKINFQILTISRFLKGLICGGLGKQKSEVCRILPAIEHFKPLETCVD
jgi:hypothetical protein